MDFTVIVRTLNYWGHVLCLRRTIAALFGFLSVCICEMQRSNLSFAVVDMVNSSTIDRGHHRDNYTTMDCPENIYNTSNLPSSTGEFLWNPILQGYVLSSGFIGNAIGQIPGGIAVLKYGSKKVFVLSLSVSSICNLLSPWLARQDIYTFIFLHFVKGFSIAMNIVSMSQLTSNWFPRKERSLAGVFITSGFETGSLVCSVAAGYICALDLWDGWPLVFYIFGLLGVSLAILFQFFYNDLPEEDPWITDSELKYIQDGKDRTSFLNRPPIPWIAMLKSKYIYIMMVGLIGQRWMIFYLKIAIPVYFGTILNVAIHQIGYLTASPYIGALVLGWLTSYASLWLNRHCKIETNRKFFNSLSTAVCSLGLIGMYFAKCDISGSVISLFIATSSLDISSAGVFITAIDVAPTFCGPVFGLTHSVGSISGFLVPLVVGELTNGAQNMLQWGKIMLLSVGIAFGCNLLWVLLGSTEVEPWDPVSKRKDGDESRNTDGLETEEVSSKM